MESKIVTYRDPDGSIQRVQTVRWKDWSGLKFLRPQGAEDALERFGEIYRRYLIPACPWLFGNLVLIRLPEGVESPYPASGRGWRGANPLSEAAIGLGKDLSFRGGKPVFRTRQSEDFYRLLESRGALQVAPGKLPFTKVIPVGNDCGYLTAAKQTAALKVNGSFFIMDPFDAATPWDIVGTPLGLQVSSGKVENPPLFRREALLVRKNGKVSVEPVALEDLKLEVGGNPCQTTRIYSRPEWAVTPPLRGKSYVIIGCRVAAVYENRPVPVPASGFVLHPRDGWQANAGDPVTYGGMEDVAFGIQVGNSILRDGVETDRFLSRFYNIRHLEPVPFPPSLYPMDFRRSRAARMALGADREGKPMILWAEGAAKVGHIHGKDSRGASLSDMGRYCREAGMVQAVNLDGGGSAQLLLGNCRSLRISDRNPGDCSDMERPVPLGLLVE